MIHEQTQKVTAHIPISSHASTYDALRKMRGKIKFSINLKKLRKDK